MDNEFNQNEEPNPEDEEMLQYEKREYFKEIIERVKQAQYQIKIIKEEIEKEKLVNCQYRVSIDSNLQEYLKRKDNKQSNYLLNQIKLQLRSYVIYKTMRESDAIQIMNQKNNSEVQGMIVSKSIRQYISLTRKELQESDEHAQRLKISIQKQTNTNLLLKTDIDEKSQKIQQLRQEASQLRAAIQNLDDVKKVINRVTDQEQVIIVKQSPKKQQKPQNKSASQQRVNYNVHDVDDNFWYGDKQIKLPSVQSNRKRD